MNEMNVNQIELCSNKNEKILCNKDERQKPIISDEHIRLADSIKRVHAGLRQKLRAGEEFDQVWKEHLENEDVLKNYSNAMKTLATKHWKKLESENEDTSRILWTKTKILDYYFNGGLNNQIIRDTNRLKRHTEKYPEEIYLTKNVEEEKETRFEEKDNGRIKLLDVGSCYNPFSQFREFEVTGLDIAPSYEHGVYKADFLTLNISDTSEFCERSVLSLSRNSFDAVVFSFLLEYLPSPAPRYESCVKARHLLKENGILVILTPDSCHQQRNNSIIRGWKQALLQIGYQQVYYEKKQHFHGLVFRKLDDFQHSLAVVEAGLDAHEEVDIISAKFIIPQDSNTREDSLAKKEDISTCNSIIQSDKSELRLEQDFHHLPDL